MKQNKTKLKMSELRSSTFSSLNREKQKKDLKAERDELMKELGISKESLKTKLPKVHGKGKNFEICARGKCKFCKTRYGRGDKGASPSVLQQVIFLREFVESTREMRKQIYEAMEAEKQKEREDENKTGSDAKIFEI